MRFVFKASPKRLEPGGLTVHEDSDTGTREDGMERSTVNSGAMTPAVLLALLVNGLTSAIVVAAGYVLINMVIGNVIEPRIMGQGLGLSTLVVFVSLILWGWVLGPVGMPLSVPLTTTLKNALETRDDTRALALLLGDTSGAAREESSE